MSKITMRTKTVETMSFAVETSATDIQNGRCGLVAACMEKVAIERKLRKLDPRGGDHKVRIDGGQIRFNLGGYKWVAPTPKTAKVSLILFDRERKARARAERQGQAFRSKVQSHNYRIEAIRGNKIRPLTRERQEQINEARRRRAAAGKPDKKKYDLRYRVEGLGTV
jgi:hypothetical protein